MKIDTPEQVVAHLSPVLDWGLVPAGFDELAAIAWDALKIRPPLLISSIFGLPWSLLPPYRRYSEYQILNLWRPLRTLRYLVNITMPSVPAAPPPFGPAAFNDFFWQPTLILQRPDHTGNYTSYPDEAWFFINGILTNSDVAQTNAAFLADLFHRPITLVQNSTTSLWMDLVQCAVGKQWRRSTEPAVKALPVIYDALKDPHKHRVVVIAHSQGTIIIATILDMLYKLMRRPAAKEMAMMPALAAPAGPELIYQSDEPLDLSDFTPLEEEELAKLEIYCFATCANVLTWRRSFVGDRPPAPWIEHFGNEQDIVARLGMLAPQAERRGILIDGARYLRHGAWGHFLNEHYLYPLAEKQRKGRKRGGEGGATPFELIGADEHPELATPRLFSYINGGSPE